MMGNSKFGASPLFAGCMSAFVHVETPPILESPGSNLIGNYKPTLRNPRVQAIETKKIAPENRPLGCRIQGLYTCLVTRLYPVHK